MKNDIRTKKNRMQNAETGWKGSGLKKKVDEKRQIRQRSDPYAGRRIFNQPV